MWGNHERLKADIKKAIWYLKWLLKKALNWGYKNPQERITHEMENMKEKIR